MDKLITKSYVTHFDEAVFMQTLASGRHVTVTYTRDRGDDKWVPVYSTDSVYSICPVTGQFKTCLMCDLYEDGSDTYFEEKCVKLIERISHKELAARATDCLNAEDCTVSFRSRYV